MKAKTAVWMVLALVVVLLGLRLTVFAPKPDDTTLVRAALAESVLASREGRAGGVLDVLSTDFKVNEDQVGNYRRDIAKFIRDSRPDLEVTNQDVLVNETDGTARIVSPVHVKIDFLGQKRDFTLKEVTMVFRKEDARNYLVIPTRKWRLVQAFVPTEALPPELVSSFSGNP